MAITQNKEFFYLSFLLLLQFLITFIASIFFYPVSTYYILLSYSGLCGKGRWQTMHIYFICLFFSLSPFPSFFSIAFSFLSFCLFSCFDITFITDVILNNHDNINHQQSWAFTPIICLVCFLLHGFEWKGDAWFCYR